MVKKRWSFSDLIHKRLEGEIKPDPIAHFSPNPSKETDTFGLKELGKKAAETAEKEVIQNVLQETHWNRKEAAKLLCVSYKALLYKIQKYRLEGLKGLERVKERQDDKLRG